MTSLLRGGASVSCVSVCRRSCDLWELWLQAKLVRPRSLNQTLQDVKVGTCQSTWPLSVIQRLDELRLFSIDHINDIDNFLSTDTIRRQWGAWPITDFTPCLLPHLMTDLSSSVTGLFTSKTRSTTLWTTEYSTIQTWVLSAVNVHHDSYTVTCCRTHSSSLWRSSEVMWSLTTLGSSMWPFTQHNRGSSPLELTPPSASSPSNCHLVHSTHGVLATCLPPTGLLGHHTLTIFDHVPHYFFSLFLIKVKLPNLFVEWPALCCCRGYTHAAVHWQDISILWGYFFMFLKLPDWPLHKHQEEQERKSQCLTVEHHVCHHFIINNF